MVERVRRGKSMRAVAREFGVGLYTVQRWVQRARGQRLDRVDWSDRPSLPRGTRRTSQTVATCILRLRKELRETSDLGEFGAVAIHRELQSRRRKTIPSVRTIGRILERGGALDGRRRIRRAAPPSGWYLPDVAAGKAELDSFDVVEGLAIRGGTQVELLTGISLRGGLTAAWPRPVITAKVVVDALISHWKRFGLPQYAQFDNDMIFQGPHAHPDSLGRVIRLCLSLNVVPVFTPPRETGFQASIENFNGRWQAKVWARFEFQTLADVQAQSQRYITATQQRSAARIEAAPARRPFPQRWKLDLQQRPSGRLVFIRRTSAQGHLAVLGRTFKVDPLWVGRLVRVELTIRQGQLRVYRLRRREPHDQPLLREHSFKLPHTPFRE